MPDPQREAPPVPEKLVRADSIIIVNTGDGKGKSSSAFGVMGRAWARGWRVVVIQFVKSGKWQVGEKKLAEHLGIEWHTMGDGFTWESTDLDETIAKGRHAWQVAKEKLTNSEYDLVILDEVTYAVSYGWVAVDDMVSALSARATTTNVIVTGRNAPKEVVELADTVTEMKMVKHAYQQGIRAKKGIEY
jgi:cob(I)alamin adenosyltransferase